MDLTGGGITERQKRFADYCIESGNARQAALRAGYTPNYANKLQKSPVVKRYIAERIRDMDEERIAGAREVLRYLTGVMRGEDEKAEKMSPSRMKAAELLGKRLGIFEGAEEAAETPVIVDDLAGGK